MNPPHMSRVQRTQHVIWLDALAAAAKREAAEHRAELARTAETEYVVEGSVASWNMPSIGTVYASTANDAVEVTDPAALLAWVTERHPGEVQQIVRPAFVELLRKTGKPAGTAVVDAEGELIPGLTFVPGGRYIGISVKPTAEAKQVFGALAEESLAAAKLTAAPAIAPELAALVADETPGHLDPSEVGE